LHLQVESAVSQCRCRI